MPTGAGGRFVAGPTVTVNICVAVVFEPPVSVAVTVTVDIPSDTGVTITVLPDTNTAATPGADDAAPYVSGSPSGSRNAIDTSTATADSSIALRGDAGDETNEEEEHAQTAHG